jgi:hypothetical protein
MVSGQETIFCWVSVHQLTVWGYLSWFVSYLRSDWWAFGCVRPTLDGSRAQFFRNQFDLIWSKLNPLTWILPWTLACILVLQIMSSPMSSFSSKPIYLFIYFLIPLYIFLIYGVSIDKVLLGCILQLIFPSKWWHVGLASICNFLSVLDPHQMVMGPIYDSKPIGLLYFSGPSTAVLFYLFMFLNCFYSVVK